MPHLNFKDHENGNALSFDGNLPEINSIFHNHFIFFK